MKLMTSIATALAVVSIQAQEPSTRTQASAAGDRTLSPYALATTLVQTLALAASARDTLAAIKSEGNPIADSMNGIVAQRGAVSRLNQAIALLDQFEAASNQAVRKGAGDLKGIYRALSSRLLAGVTLWEKFAKAKTSDDIAALVPESGKTAAEVQDAWRLLPLGVAAVTDALVDPVRLSDGKLAYLRVTRDERTRLNTEIKQLFPSVRAEEKGGQVVDVSVNLFREFLNGGWKSADDK